MSFNFFLINKIGCQNNWLWTREKIQITQVLTSSFLPQDSGVELRFPWVHRQKQLLGWPQARLTRHLYWKKPAGGKKQRKYKLKSGDGRVRVVGTQKDEIVRNSECWENEIWKLFHCQIVLPKRFQAVLCYPPISSDTNGSSLILTWSFEFKTLCKPFSLLFLFRCIMEEGFKYTQLFCSSPCCLCWSWLHCLRKEPWGKKEIEVLFK